MTTRQETPDRVASIEATSVAAAAIVAGLISACSVPATDFETAALVQRAYLKPLHVRPDDTFGHSIALSADGSTLAVGATGDSSNDPRSPSSSGAPDSGAVHVFRRSGTSWIEDGYVKASRIVPVAQFGYSVALSRDGSVLAVGAPGESDDSCEAFSGAAYVLARQGGTWVEQQRFALGLCQNEGFGTSVALSDDGATLAVGIPGGHVGDDATTDEPSYPGKVHVHVRGDAGWGAAIAVSVPNRGATTGDAFGKSVALSGDGSTLAVGATLDSSVAADAGAVYVSTRDAWTQLTRLDAPNADQDDGFGTRVALSRDGAALAASASFENGSGVDPTNNLVDNSGAVYVFTRSRSAWSSPAYVKAGNPGERDFFGASLAISDDAAHLVVGAYGEDSSSTGIDQDAGDNRGTDSGAAYVFASDGATYRQEAYVKPSNTGRDEAFGNSVAMSADGSTVVVGAFREGGKQGAAYVFERIP